MADLLQVFREKAENLFSTINRKGGVRATIESLRRQMAEADRRRETNKVKAELRRLDRQINEMILAVGVQAVGLHEAGRLTSPELCPLCQHIVELKAALAQQETDLAKLEAVAEKGQADTDCASPNETHCRACGKRLPDEGTFCPYCGTRAPVRGEGTCASCGAPADCASPMRPRARFCAKCGQAVGDSS